MSLTRLTTGKYITGSTYTVVRPVLPPMRVGTSIRPFSSSSLKHIRLFLPSTETENIRKTPPAWPHPIYTDEQLKQIGISHRETRNFGDKVALSAIRTLRWGFDLVSGYRHDDAVAAHAKDPAMAKQKYSMTEEKYLIRNIFLESIAGVPGMVGGMLRHLRSLRRMRRDNGWIETLLEESYNERMHLLTFLQMAEPGFFLHLCVLGAQGVFFNAFLMAYLVNPRICHRFVGYLEEEAIITYTREISDIDAGKLPKWEKMQAPNIAVQYWNMPEGYRSVKDLLLYIRADEAKHREVNHTFANLNWKEDPNPYVSQYKDEGKPRPSKAMDGKRQNGWERQDVI
ncbi:Alternative oxidase, mitochondrial precursor [Monascus purpureus]|uniref:Alternative oxidase n=1 Tax=Monascus purpureus TaxID=5098 RepID=A0A507QZW1_MONPU|nr:Alternative oxidase, mitochondrial precursor [Monascus purpureus]BDD62837.1 Alternative oxidase, mitochondrial precursor [Monascus purpureus]